MTLFTQAGIAFIASLALVSVATHKTVSPPTGQGYVNAAGWEYISTPAIRDRVCHLAEIETARHLHDVPEFECTGGPIEFKDGLYRATVRGKGAWASPPRADVYVQAGVVVRFAELNTFGREINR